MEHLDAENRKRLQKYMESIDQMERLIRLRSNLQLLEQQRAQGDQGDIRVELQGMKIGDFVLVTFPGEPFAEIGVRIKKRSPCKYTYVAGYANGYVEYAPTAEYGSLCYENSHTPFAPEWEGIYETKVLEMIERLDSDRPAPQPIR